MVSQTTSEWGRVICDAKLGLLAVGTARWFGDEHLGRLWIGLWIVLVFMTFRKVRIRPLYLYKALATNLLIAASGAVEVGRII